MIDDEDPMDLCKEELKRVDHLIYVSLKYTRTCDVFKNTITRMIDAIGFCLDAILRKLKEDGKIPDIPQAARAKAELVKEQFQDEKIQELVAFYLQLRQINRAEFTRAQEYRRHVTMTCIIEGSKVIVNIDIITEYFRKLKELVAHVERLVEGETA